MNWDDCGMKFGKNCRRLRRMMLVPVLLAAPAAMLGEDALKVPTAQALEAAVSKVQPQYPAMAKQLKVEGMVEMQVIITDAGTVDSVSPVSGNPILARAAVDALKKWKFTPFKSDGKTVKATTTISMSFKL
jgi:periplasmic protein TonB